jgi:hypothetical protein
VIVREPKRSARKIKKGKKGRKGTKAKPAKKSSLDLAIPLLDLFREEFFVALGQALNWSDEDAQEFWHDLELYETLTQKEPRRQAGRTTRAVASGPFVDRTALLLDPSLMEQARRAAGKFQLELNTAADRVLHKVFARRRGN